MMNIMYRHIMYRGKNTSVPTVETRRGTSYTLRVGARRTHYVSGHVAHITRRGTSYTLRVGVCRVEHCRVGARRVKHYVSGFVASNIVVSWFVVLVFVRNDEQRSTLQHYNNITLSKASNKLFKEINFVD